MYNVLLISIVGHVKVWGVSVIHFCQEIISHIRGCSRPRGYFSSPYNSLGSILLMLRIIKFVEALNQRSPRGDWCPDFPCRLIHIS